MDLFATGSATGVTHVASCPEIAPVTCAREAVEDHLHVQTIGLLRLQPGLMLGLGKGFQLRFRLPVDIKTSAIDYQTLEGSGYTPPYGDIHHRNETLGGLGDASLGLGLVGRVAGTPVVLGLALGAVLPTGRTEEDPFVLGAQEREHQHLQFGGGTVNPQLELFAIVQTTPFGFLATGGGVVPFYSNPKGYRGAIVVQGAVGSIFQPPEPLDRVQLLVQLHARHAEPEYWNDLVGKNSGLDSLAVSLGAQYRLSRKTTVQAEIKTNILESSRGTQFEQPVTLTLGVSGVVSLPRPGGPQPH